MIRPFTNMRVSAELPIQPTRPMVPKSCGLSDRVIGVSVGKGSLVAEAYESLSKEQVLRWGRRLGFESFLNLKTTKL